MGCCCSADKSRMENAIENTKSIKDVKANMKRDKAYKYQALETLSHSFAGTDKCEPDPLFNWLMGPDVADKVEHAQERNKRTWFMMNFAFHQHGLFADYSYVFQTSDDEKGTVKSVSTEHMHVHVPDSSQPGNVVAVTEHSVPAALIVVRVYPKGFNLVCGEGSIWPAKVYMGMESALMPTITSDKAQATEMKAFQKRMEDIDKILYFEHKRLFKGKPHIYVPIVAVSPEAQGTGQCSAMMRAINSMADSLQLPCYLETGGTRHRDIYARYGYDVASTKQQIGANIDDKWVVNDFFFMVREPASSK